MSKEVNSATKEQLRARTRRAGQAGTRVPNAGGGAVDPISTGGEPGQGPCMEQMRESEARFRQVTENIREVLWLSSIDKNQVLYVSPAYEAIWGRSCQSLYDQPRSWLDAIHPDDRERAMQAALNDQVAGRYAVEYRILRPDGSQRWILDRAFPIRDAAGEVYRIAGIAEDITAARNAREALRTSEAQLRAIIETEPECVKIVGPGGVLRQMNAAGLAMIEADSFQQVAGKSIYPLVNPEYRKGFRALTEQVLAGGKGTFEFEIVGLKGTPRWLETHAVPIVGEDGQTCLLGVTRDITERKRSEERLNYLVHHDPLTGLPNRNVFHDRLQQAMVEAHRHGRVAAVVLLDLDDFKNVNEGFGHATGDQLLRDVGARLRRTVRDGDTVTHMAGDQFALVLANMAQAEDAIQVVQKILSSVSTPFMVAEREFYVTASLGIALYPLDVTTSEGLLRAADTAMHRAKARGANSYQFYTQEMTSRMHAQISLENDLRRALDNGQLALHYQPLVDMHGGAILGAEALLRWHHPVHGFVPPADFIPLAERSGLILPIGAWVLRQACAQARAWQAPGRPFRIAVNLSARQFMQGSLVSVVADILETTRLDPTCLELEITEGTLMQITDEVAVNLREILHLGVRFSIDDFGTHYSSFAYLKRFRVHTLKIDRSFVAGVLDDGGDAEIVRAMASLGRNLGVEVVAEGVETAGQLEFLRGTGAHVCQGYLFSKPLPAEAFDALLANHPHDRLDAPSVALRQHGG